MSDSNNSNDGKGECHGIDRFPYDLDGLGNVDTESVTFDSITTDEVTIDGTTPGEAFALGYNYAVLLMVVGACQSADTNVENADPSNG